MSRWPGESERDNMGSRIPCTHRCYLPVVVVVEGELDRRRYHCSARCMTHMPGRFQVSNSSRCYKSIDRKA